VRYLLIGIVVVVLLILCAVLVGALLPKRHVVSRSASYRATPEELFALIAGPQSWRPDVTHFEILPSTNGRELARETTRNGETITYEVLERVPPKSLKRRIATENLPYAGTWTYMLQTDRGMTIVRITEDGEVYNPVFRFVSRFILGQTRTMDDYLRALGRAAGEEVAIKN
jgi:polyketide cyclase/dehydrase/lipid transport protein